MRTGAIFARGSCRALKWMALVSVVFALGGGQVMAQPDVEGATYAANVVTVTMESAVRVSSGTATDLAFGAFTIAGNPATAHTVDVSVGGAATFTVTFTNNLAGISTQMTYTAPTTGARIADATSGVGVDTFTVPVLPATPWIPRISNREVQRGVKLEEGDITLPEAVGGTGTLTYSITTTLPTGLTFEADTRTIEGTTTDAVARTSQTYSVTDGTNTNTGTFFLDVVEPPALSVTVSAAPMTIAEGGTSTITAMANRPVTTADGTVTVSLAVVGDATLSASSITIAAGAESGSVTLTAAEDDDYEPETVTVTATVNGITGSQNIEIAVTDMAPPEILSVVVSADPTTIAEGGTSTITAMANRAVMASDGTVTVNLRVVGEATLSANSITIAAGAQSGSVTLTSTADDDYEPDTVTVTAAGDGVAANHPNVVINVTDMAPPSALTVTVSANPGTIAEGGTSTITAMANRMVVAGDGTVTVNLSVIGDATLSTNLITIAAGAQSGAVVLTSTQDDDYVDDTVTVTASGTGIQGNVEFMVNVTDDDQPPAKLRGQITAMKMRRGSSGSNSTEVEKIIVGGTSRYHVTEGVNDAWLAVTVQWTHEEIAEMAGAAQYVHVEIMGGSGLPIPGVNWVSWIDQEGDADFPQGSTLGRLRARVSVTPPRTATPAGSSRHVLSRTGYVRVLLPVDQHEAENDAFFIQAIDGGNVDLSATAAVNTTTPVVIIEDVTPQTVTVSRKRGEPSTIYEGAPSPQSSTVAGQALYTVTAKPPRVDLPLEVRMDLLDPEGALRAGDVSLSHSVVTLNPNMDAMGNSQDMYLSLPYPDGDRVDDHYKLQASVVVYSLTSGGEENTNTPSSTDITVYDRHKLPWLTVSPVSGVVTEGDEDGIDLELTVNRNPANTISTDPEVRQYTSEALTIAVDASGSSNFTMTPSSISVDEYKHTAAKGWMQKVKVKITAEDDEDIDAETLMLNFAVNGTVSRNGKPRPSVDDGVRQEDYDKSMAMATLTIQDATNALVSVRENAYDVIKGALGDPPMLTTGMSAELMGSNLFDYDSSAVSVAYGTSVEGGAVTASASGGTVTVMGAMAGEAKVTITATATPNASSLVVNQTKSNVAQLTFPVMVEDEDLVFMVSGPDDMNLAEGGMGGMVTVTTNRPVTENTEVMLMRDGSSSASEDDYTLEPPLVTIMAGHEMGSTMVMATEDNMAEDMEMLTLFLVVDGMQMTDKSVSFYLWDAAVPALPVIGQFLLAALMAVGGYRRYRRR